MIFLDLFWTFFKIGLFTFGGGYAMLPLIQAAVEEHGWLSTETLLNFVAVSESTPGPFAVNIATYIGSELAGIAGAACATLGVVLPSFVIILIVARCFRRFRASRIVAGIMTGLKPAALRAAKLGIVKVIRYRVEADILQNRGGVAADLVIAAQQQMIAVAGVVPDVV